MNNGLNIGIDIDGVIADFVGSFIPLVNEKYRVKISENDIRMHDLFLVLGLPEDEVDSLIAETIESGLKLIKDARESLNQLAAHNLILLTARRPELMDLTKQWLEDNKIPHSKLENLQEAKKHLTDDELDVFINDNLAEIIGMIGKAKRILVYDHPWNQSLNAKGLFQRVKDWRDILDIVEKVEREDRR